MSATPTLRSPPKKSQTQARQSQSEDLGDREFIAGISELLTAGGCVGFPGGRIPSYYEWPVRVKMLLLPIHCAKEIGDEMEIQPCTHAGTLFLPPDSQNRANFIRDLQQRLETTIASGVNPY